MVAEDDVVKSCDNVINPSGRKKWILEKINYEFEVAEDATLDFRFKFVRDCGSTPFH